MSISRKANKSLVRKTGTRSTNNIIAIAFEAADKRRSRERKYFEMLIRENTNSRIKIVRLYNEDHKSAINHVFDRLTKYTEKNDLDLTKMKNPDQAWMVIDVDNQKDDILAKLKDIRDKNFRLAISNPCFEIWLYLHGGEIEIKDNNVVFKNFINGEPVEEAKELNTRQSSQEVKRIFNKLIKGKRIDEKFLLKARDAIKKSENLHNKIKDEDLLNDGKGKTKVHELVKEILRK